MRMKVSVIAVLVAALSTAWLVRDGRAETRYFSGTSCNGNTPGDNQWAGRDNTGCTSDFDTGSNPCSTPLLLIIPVVGNSTDTVTYTGVDVSYRKLTSATLSCAADVTNSSGTAYQGSAVNITSTGFGTRTFSGTELPNGGSVISSARVQHVFCFVPGFTWTIDGCGVGNSCCTGPTTWVMDAKVTVSGTF